MNLLILFITLSQIIFISADLSVNPLSEEYISYINSKQSSWKAGRNFDPKTPLIELRARSGVLKQTVKPLEQLRKTHDISEDDIIPTEFDAREEWSKCESIGEIVDQASCGSCWAVSTCQAISDRICIHSEGKLQPRISARNLMTCCGGHCGMGCGGGLPSLSFNYWVGSGIVSGGAYNTTNWCQSYPFPPCEHYNVSGDLPACPEDIPFAPDCLNTCDDGSTLNYDQDFYFGESSYDVTNDSQQIQLEIMTNGPVVAIMHMYYDWFSYKSGVFIPISTDTDNWAGEHAVRILGWGVENDIPYWIVANSFNEDWGDKGFFKIRRDTNECGIEERIVAGMPKL